MDEVLPEQKCKHRIYNGITNRWRCDGGYAAKEDCVMPFDVFQCQWSKDEENNSGGEKDPNGVSKELANAHWSYIEKLLKCHGVGTSIIDIVGYHYVSSFIHGFKHGVEYIENGN